METLSIKELAPYLPYGVRIKNATTEMPLTGAYLDELEDPKWGFDGSYKPLLRPLSKLINDIDRAYATFGEKDNQTLKNIELSNDTQQYQNLEYSTILYLLKNHYDFQNLIKKGYAIDLNTIKETVK